MACTLFGLTPEESLVGVTRTAARALGMADRVGTLAVGRAGRFSRLGHRPSSGTGLRIRRQSAAADRFFAGTCSNCYSGAVSRRYVPTPWSHFNRTSSEHVAVNPHARIPIVTTRPRMIRAPRARRQRTAKSWLTEAASADADEQPRPGRGRAAGGPGGLRRHRPGGTRLAVLRRDRRRAQTAGRRRDAA